MENKFKVNDLVKYVGVPLPAIGLTNDLIYTVESVTDFGAVSLKELNSSMPLSFNPNQFVEADIPDIFDLDFASPVGSPEESDCAKTIADEVLEIIPEDQVDKVAEDYAFLSTPQSDEALTKLAEAGQDLVKHIDRINERAVKFKNKPGSAVVHYKSGATFHISCLTSIAVFEHGEDVLIDVTRTYMKDGLIFSQTVGIPVDMFDKVVYKPSIVDREEIVDSEVVVSYDTERKELVYPLTYSTKALELV